MSEKKKRVSKYQRMHVDANEFKKQQVVNEEGIKRLQKFQNISVHLNGEKDDPKVKVFNVASFEEDFVKDSSIVEVEVVEKAEVVVANTTDTVEYEEKEEIKPSKRRKKTRKERWHNFGMGFFTFCNVCALICFFVVYGPFYQVRDWFVTTAMTTMSKKFLANVLYSNATIQEVLATNITIEPNQVMDSNAISIGNLEAPTVYSSIYEEQVLKRDEGNDLYKVIRLDEDGYKGYITFVYDPTAIQLSVTKYLGTIGQFVTTHAKQNNAAVAINGGGFVDIGGKGTGGLPAGYVYKDGKIVWSRKRDGRWGGGTIGFSKDGVLILTKSTGKKALEEGVYNGVDFGPFLIVNGVSASFSGNAGFGIQPRTVIGQRKDGIVVFLTVDGRSTKSTGISLNKATAIMERYDVYNAANLDGGASTVLAVEGKLMNKPVAHSVSGEREVPTAWIVVPHAEAE